MAFRLTIFWVLIAVSTLLFFLGLWNNLSLWLEGSVRGASGASKAGKLRALLGSARAAISERGLSALLGSLIRDGLLHRELFAKDKLRWAAHTSLAMGFLLLFALSTFTGFFEEILHQALGISTPFVLAVIDKDTPVMAVLNEALGLFLLFGVAIILVRRYGTRPSQLRTAGADTSILVLLGIGLLTAYPTEAFRFLMEQTPPSVGWYSFAGYPLAQALRPLDLAWAQWHFAAFFLHVLPFMVLLVYMPFSKFLHVLISPIVATANAMLEGARR